MHQIYFRTPLGPHRNSKTNLVHFVGGELTIEAPRPFNRLGRGYPSPFHTPLDACGTSTSAPSSENTVVVERKYST